MKFSVQTICDQGEVRPNNEDAIRYGLNESSNLMWMVVADGMGGHKAGEVASAMLVESVEQKLCRVKLDENLDWQNILSDALEQANIDIHRAALENEDYTGMGTTGVLVVCYLSTLYVAWVGDSRLYRLRENQLEQLTIDHTMIQYLLDKGSITAAEAERSNTKHILSKAIGSKPEVEVEFSEFVLQSGDVLMLSTDGAHDYLADAIIAGFLAQAKNGKDITKALVEQALKQKSRDNLTIGIISVKDKD